MITINQIADKLATVKDIDNSEVFHQSILKCFEGYTYGGDCEVLLAPLPVSEEVTFIIDDAFTLREGAYSVCVNKIGSPEVHFTIEILPEANTFFISNIHVVESVNVEEELDPVSIPA